MEPRGSRAHEPDRQGNRTVRGMEGILCSFLPLPGDAIVKRDRSENVASIARFLSAGLPDDVLRWRIRPDSTTSSGS